MTKKTESEINGTGRFSKHRKSAPLPKKSKEKNNKEYNKYKVPLRETPKAKKKSK